MKDLFKSLLLCYLITAGVVMFFSSFDADCKHIYVASQPNKVERDCKITAHPMMPHFDDLGGMGYRQPEPGTHTQEHDEKNMAEGIALVCVKCFNETRQKIHYKHKE